MDYDKFKKKIDKYIEYNSDIVDEYNSFSECPFQSSVRELYNIVENIRDKYNGISIYSILNMILPIAINDKTSVVSVAENVFENGLFNNSSSKSSLQIYFEDVKNTYDKNGNNYDIEYCQDNRDKLIEMNLKTVISIAKKFKGLGLPMEDLIGAGNLGLCVAFDKFDPNRIKIKDNIIDIIDETGIEEFEYSNILEILSPILEYGKSKKKFFNDFHKNKKYSKQYIKDWINHNINSARFNSVAVMWIRAYILIELDNYSRIIKKSKSDIKNEKYNGKDVYISIDEPINDNYSIKTGDVLVLPDDSFNTIDNIESQIIFRDFMALALEGIKVRNKRILLQRFGIGYPRPMTPKEIAAKEKLSIARVSQIVQNTLAKIKSNCEKKNIDIDYIYSVIDNKL